MIPATLLLLDGRQAHAAWIHSIDKRAVRRWWARFVVVGENEPLPGLGLKLIEREWGGVSEFSIELSNCADPQGSVEFTQLILPGSEVTLAAGLLGGMFRFGMHAIEEGRSLIARFSMYGTSERRLAVVDDLDPLMAERKLQGLECIEPVDLRVARFLYDVAVQSLVCDYDEGTGIATYVDSSEAPGFAEMARELVATQFDPHAKEMDTVLTSLANEGRLE